MPAPDLTPQTPGDTNANTTTASETTAPAYDTEHRGGGRYVVIDNAAALVDGKTVKIGDFIGTKDEALAEIDRLTAGGEPYVKPAEDTNANTTVEQATPAATDDIDPTTISAAVLTPSGWLCPEK